MTNISEIIEEILVEWAYRVHDGMPNPKNAQHIHELRESMEELNLPNNVIYQVIQNLINEVTDKETKFKARSKETNKIIYYKNQDNLDAAVKSGHAIPYEKGDGEETEEPETKKGMTYKDSDEYMSKEKNTEDKPKSKADNQRNKIGGKSFSQPAEMSDNDFNIKNNENKTTDTFIMPDSVKNNPKIPKKYTQFIERVMNTQKNTKDKNNYSSYYGLGKVGAGNTDANAGELLSMMATTMNRNDRADFFRNVDEHIQKAKANGEKIYITPAWSKAAKENSSAVLRMMYDKYGKDYEIVAGAWDVEEEFESLGFDYKDKGYSTDIMFKVKVGDTVVKEEISLKQKLKNQRLWNGTLGSAFGEDILPQHLQQKGVNQFKENQVKNIDNFYQNNQTNINEFLGSVNDNDDYNETLTKTAKIMDNKETNQALIKDGFNGFLSQHKKDLVENSSLVLSRDYIKENLKKQGVKSDKRAIDKLSMTLGLMMSDYGDDLGGEFVKQQKSIAKEHAKDVATFINTSDEAKSSVLKKVQEKLPLKSVSDGDESIILGEFVINKKTMEGIFGTSDWNQVVEQLTVNPEADPPAIQYSGKVRGQDVIVPITTIGIREDGEGYGGSHKFEMLVAQDFGKYVESVSRDIFGDQEPIKFPDSAATLRAKEEE